MCVKKHKCVYYLIPRGLLALVILPFKIISFSCETDVGQPSEFVQIVEVLVNLRCNSLMCTKCWPFKSFASQKYRAFARSPVNSHLVGFSWTKRTCPTCALCVLLLSCFVPVQPREFLWGHGQKMADATSLQRMQQTHRCRCSEESLAG